MPLEIPVSQGDNEGKSKLDVSNPYLRQQLKGFCQDEGLEIDSIFEHLDIDKGTCLLSLGKGVNKERDLEKESGRCPRRLRCFKDSTSGRALKKLIIMGLVLVRIWWHEAFGICPTQRIRIRGKKKQVSLDIFVVS